MVVVGEKGAWETNRAVWPALGERCREWLWTYPFRSGMAAGAQRGRRLRVQRRQRQLRHANSHGVGRPGRQRGARAPEPEAGEVVIALARQQDGEDGEQDADEEDEEMSDIGSISDDEPMES